MGAQSNGPRNEGNAFFPPRFGWLPRCSSAYKVHSRLLHMTEIPKLVSAEGWHVLHLFYKVEHGQWSLLDAADKMRARTNLSDLIEEIRTTEGCQVLTFSMVGPKADVG